MNNKLQQAIIFDLDGTLVDTAIITMEAFRSVAQEMDLEVPSIALLRRAIGYANPEFYDRIYPELPIDVRRLAGQRIEQEEKRLMTHTDTELLFPDCLRLLQILQQREILLYVASTGSEEHVYAIMEKAGICSFFNEVYYGAPDKTEAIRTIIGDSAKAGFLMVGDMEKDYRAAHSNEIAAVGACYGYCVREVSDFDYYIKKPLELLEIELLK